MGVWMVYLNKDMAPQNANLVRCSNTTSSFSISTIFTEFSCSVDIGLAYPNYNSISLIDIARALDLESGQGLSLLNFRLSV